MTRREYLRCLHEHYLNEARQHRLRREAVTQPADLKGIAWSERRAWTQRYMQSYMEYHFTQKAARCLLLLNTLDRKERDRHPWRGFRHTDG